MLAPKENFNEAHNGKPVNIYYLQNKGLAVAITNYGARIVNLVVPDIQGNFIDVIVGCDSYESFYQSKEPYFGTIIGRFCNRIANRKFAIDGIQFCLPENSGSNTLHGGPGSFHTVVWDVLQHNENLVKLSYLSRDGDQGFPGNMKVYVTYSVNDEGELRIDFEAESDKKTVCNLTNHAFFNLNGSGGVGNHMLMINADKFIPINA